LLLRWNYLFFNFTYKSYHNIYPPREFHKSHSLITATTFCPWSCRIM